MTERTIQLLCVKEVAARLGVADKTCAKLLRTGQLDGFKLSGKYWRTTEVHVQAYVARKLHEQRQTLSLVRQSAAA